MEVAWDVVVVGSCMIDLVCYAPRLPKSGETLRGSNFISGFGGKGCNQCVAAKKLGANCLLIARIGNDSFGNNYSEKLLQYKIPKNFVKTTEGVPTGMAQITVADTGENQIVIVPGANDSLTEEDIKEANEHIASCAVLICQLEIPESVTIEALKIKANSKRGKSILNAAPAHSDLNPQLLTLPDIFCVNETEAETLTGTPVTNVEEAKIAIEKLLSKGCSEVIITLGKEGSAYGKPGPDFIHVPTTPVNTVDTTVGMDIPETPLIACVLLLIALQGAGDAFIGAFAFFLATQPELPMQDMLKKANSVAAFSVQREGTQESFPFIDDLIEFNSL